MMTIKRVYNDGNDNGDCNVSSTCTLDSTNKEIVMFVCSIDDRTNLSVESDSSKRHTGSSSNDNSIIECFQLAELN